MFEKLKGLLLRRKLRQINQIDAINWGGCAIVAYGLQKHLGSGRIIYLMTDYDISNGNVERIKNGEADNCCHAVLEVDGKYIDSTGIWSKEKLLEKWRGVKESLEVSSELVLKSINESPWNPAFSRKTTVPKIDSILGLKGDLVSAITI